jgi:hypothetical protein
MIVALPPATASWRRRLRRLDRLGVPLIITPPLDVAAAGAHAAWLDLQRRRRVRTWHALALARW